ncbi:MAG: SAM-dependent methyltransferase [Chloroflexi bacterium]|nr:SAM-dependent methyltransferase [Chloroflexota bacterium]MBV9596290.1 SAM-dependent methyltransferase [Chloroflexota bacterium]
MSSTPVEDELRRQIADHGPVSFRDLMLAALYHPRFGYYTNLRGFGPDGDFITSPERHPAFGWLLGRQVLEVWQALERPRPFRILELGAGSGALAEPLVRFLRSEGVSDLVYTLDEVSPTLRELQRRRLTDPAFRWNGVDEPANFVVANEVADALPVHRAIIKDGHLHEMLVTVDRSGELTWTVAEQPHAALDAYFQALHVLPNEGEVMDICLELENWVESIARRLERGMALVIDYTASPPRDSLLTYYRHTLGSDPFVRLGEQDISARVDLRTLVRFGIARGLKAGAVAQRGLLYNLGFPQVQAHLTGMTDREALAHLVDMNAAGGQIVAVFLLGGMPEGYKPAGAVGRDWPEPGEVPSLPPNADEADFLGQWREAFGPPDGGRG